MNGGLLLKIKINQGLVKGQRDDYDHILCHDYDHGLTLAIWKILILVMVMIGMNVFGRKTM